MRAQNDWTSDRWKSRSAASHPGQVGTVRAAYRPGAEEVAAARELLAAARRTPGVFAFRGRMVDAPLIRHAERLVRRAGA